MSIECPDCGEHFRGKKCSCGYSVNQSSEKSKGTDYTRFMRCEANGCICRGPLDGVCRFHYGTSKENWPGITQRLKDNEWVLVITKWIRNEGHLMTHKDILERLKTSHKFNDCEELRPTEDELPAKWIIRAESWILRGIH